MNVGRQTQQHLHVFLEPYATPPTNEIICCGEFLLQALAFVYDISTRRLHHIVTTSCGARIVELSSSSIFCNNSLDKVSSLKWHLTFFMGRHKKTSLQSLQPPMSRHRHQFNSRQVLPMRASSFLEWGRCTFTLLLIMAMLLVRRSDAQTIGVDICACQPAVYTFSFDFQLLCADRNIDGPGIIDSSCIQVNVVTNNETNLPFVAVSSIRILELDQELQTTAQTQINGDFRTGDNFTYTSIIATEFDNFNASSIPRGIQLDITGRNAFDQQVVNTWAILYSNDCGIFPILFEGEFIGVTIIVCIDFV
jgi:hypothetical protein